MVNKEHVLHLLHTLDQDLLAIDIEQLTADQLAVFYKQLVRYGPDTLLRQRDVLADRAFASLEDARSPVYEEGSLLRDAAGHQAIAEGKVAALVLAGGLGTRLGSNMPKALFEVSPVRGKTLLQIALEKTKNLSDQIKRSLQIAILLSDKTIQDTQVYLVKHAFFGLHPSQITLVCQENMPFLTPEGSWCLEHPGQIAEGPNGNGRAFLSLQKAGLLDHWKSMGIRYINVMPIDNPLADPYPADLIGLHEEKKVDVTLKAVEKMDPHESVGTVAMVSGGVRIIEYSDLDRTKELSTSSYGNLANIGLMSFTLSFIQAHLEKMEGMPWHLAYKSADVFDGEKGCCKKHLWKFESFIFDLFAYTKSIAVLKVLRENCYSPLKNQSGDKSIQSVQRDLLNKYKTIYSELSGLKAPMRDFELASQFWYPTEVMKVYWKNRLLPEKSYIEPQAL